MVARVGKLSFAAASMATSSSEPEAHLGFAIKNELPLNVLKLSERTIRSKKPKLKGGRTAAIIGASETEYVAVLPGFVVPMSGDRGV